MDAGTHLLTARFGVRFKSKTKEFRIKKLETTFSKGAVDKKNVGICRKPPGEKKIALQCCFLERESDS